VESCFCMTKAEDGVKVVERAAAAVQKIFRRLNDVKALLLLDCIRDTFIMLLLSFVLEATMKTDQVLRVLLFSIYLLHHQLPGGRKIEVRQTKSPPFSYRGLNSPFFTFTMMKGDERHSSASSSSSPAHLNDFQGIYSQQ